MGLVGIVHSIECLIATDNKIKDCFDLDANISKDYLYCVMLEPMRVI